MGRKVKNNWAILLMSSFHQIQNYTIYFQCLQDDLKLTLQLHLSTVMYMVWIGTGAVFCLRYAHVQELHYKPLQFKIYQLMVCLVTNVAAL